jgi:hypothetical protein
MLLGYHFVYVPGYWQLLLLLLLMAPVLLFLGYHLAKWLFGRKGTPAAVKDPVRVYVLPPNLTWEVYTYNRDIVQEISQAVLQAQTANPRSDFTYSYAQIEKYLEQPEVHRVAQQVGSFEVYAADGFDHANMEQVGS